MLIVIVGLSTAYNAESWQYDFHTLLCTNKLYRRLAGNDIQIIIYCFKSVAICVVITAEETEEFFTWILMTVPIN